MQSDSLPTKDMKEIKLVPGLLILWTLYSCMSNTHQAENEFQGMWKLDKIESFDILTNKWIEDSARIGWNGYILYDGHGHMGVHIIPKGYKDIDTNINIDSLPHDELKELVRFYKSNFVYFANYNLNESTIQHDRITATEPRNWGTTLIRDFHFKGDTLILTPKENIAGLKLRLRWIKL